MRYCKKWDRAADDGLVPHREEPEPGQEVELPDADVWSSNYVPWSGAASERGTAIAAATEAEDIRPAKALEVTENPTALRAAIPADPSTARAARRALLDRVREDPGLRAELARDVVRTDDQRKAVATGNRSAERIDHVRRIAESGQIRTPAGQTVEAPPQVREEAERRLSLLDERTRTRTPPSGPARPTGRSGRWCPRSSRPIPNCVQERRTRFHHGLQKATKIFEELTPDDAQELYEDDTVRQLEDQRAIGACLSALRGERHGSRQRVNIG